MGVSYYGFAFFIFLLLCAFALLCKYLFGQNKGRIQNLDEKEKKLLTLYSTMEDMMDEFNQTAAAANEEMNLHIAEMRKAKAEPPQPPPPAVLYAAPPPAPPSPPRPAALAGDLRNAEPPAAEIQHLTPLSLPGVTVKSDRLTERPARILALHRQGMDRVHIAKQLSVTLSEVDLVLGLAAR